MAYLNEDGLARYDGLVKSWVTYDSGTVDGLEPLLNWQKTGTAASVTCYPLPAAPLEPVVNFLFTETPPVGDKTPDNPSTITGVSQAKVTRCGKNLIPFPYVSSSQESGGITWTVNSDGTVTASGTATANSFFTFYGPDSGILKPGVQYSLSCCPSGGSASTYYVRFGSGTVYDDTGSGSTFVADAALASRNLIARIASGTVLSTPITFKPQLELGSTATSFEPYSGTDYTVNLGGTYYGGSVDLSTGVMTVTWVRDEIASFNTIIGTTSTLARLQFWASKKYAGSGGDNSYCVNTWFPSAGNADSETVKFRYSNSASVECDLTLSRLGMTTSNTNQEILDAANAYIASNPLVLVYKTTEPTTVQLTPTQIYSLSQVDAFTPRLNTVYSDQNSVQVGYPKSPIYSAQGFTNAIISLGGNI